jgi:hypothetical protein
MIPKTIHYCWFGGKPIPKEYQRYIDSWRKYMPDYEIKRWDESNFDVNARLYTRQAYFAKKYAFVSDVARLHALVTEGGLYFDTDILVKKSFPEDWFKLDAFAGFEHLKYVQTGVMACRAGHPVFVEFLKRYDQRQFFKGLSYDITTNVAIFTEIMRAQGFKMDNTLQTIDNFTVFPQIYLCGNDWRSGRYDTDDTYAVHDFSGAWGRDALRNMIKFRCTMATTIMRWHLANHSK